MVGSRNRDEEPALDTFSVAGASRERVDCRDPRHRSSLQLELDFRKFTSSMPRILVYHKIIVRAHTGHKGAGLRHLVVGRQLSIWMSSSNYLVRV